MEQVVDLGNVAHLFDILELRNYVAGTFDRINFARKEYQLNGTMAPISHITKEDYILDRCEGHYLYSANGFKGDVDEYGIQHTGPKWRNPRITVEFDKRLLKLSMPIIEHFKMKCAYIKTIYQRPCEVNAIHADIFEKNETIFDFMNNTSEDVMRYYLFLEDWKPGHHFFAEDKVYQWKAGDMVKFASYAVHGACNIGNLPKLSITFTGKP